MLLLSSIQTLIMAISLGPLTFDFSTVDWKVVIGLTALVVTVALAIYFQWWRNRKRFSYEIVSNVLLVSAEAEIRDKVEIKYSGETVTNVRLLVIKLINDGYQPIKKEDFEKPIRFMFPEARVLTVERIKAQPWNLNPELGHNPHFVQIDPALFNRKDYFQFKVLLTDYKEMKVDARIVGIAVVGQFVRARFNQLIWLLAGSAVVQLAFLGLVVDEIGIKFAATVFLVSVTSLSLALITIYRFDRR